MKKIQLPFNLLPHLDGTAIATCYGLKNRSSDGHTVIELSSRDTHDLLTLLKALEVELDGRCQKWQKQMSKSPIGFSRRAGVELHRQAVRRAVELIETELAEAKQSEKAKH